MKLSVKLPDADVGAARAPAHERVPAGEQTELSGPAARGPQAGPVPGEPPPERTGQGPIGLVALALAAAVVDCAGAPGALRAVLTLAVALLLPGSAVLSRMRVSDRVSAATLTVAASLAIEILVSLVMAWTGAWHPVAAAWVIGGGSVAVLCFAQGRLALQATRAARTNLRAMAERPSTESLALAAPLLTGLVAWLVALPSIHASAFGESGLVGQAPIVFFIGLAVTIGGAAFLASRPDPNGWLLAAYLVAVLLFLYGTIPSIASAPQYAWTYKHIGVTRLIGLTGTVHPSVDIYNRWPGFFTLAAAFSSVSGVDSVSYAGWAEFLFAALQALAVGALVYRLTGRRQVAGLCTLLWLVTNWIGQTYFSPQALAFVLDMAVMLILVPDFRAAGWLADRLTAVLEGALRVPRGLRGHHEAPVIPSRGQIGLVASARCRSRVQPPAHPVHGPGPGRSADAARPAPPVAARGPGRAHARLPGAEPELGAGPLRAVQRAQPGRQRPGTASAGPPRLVLQPRGRAAHAHHPAARRASARRG